MNWAFGYVLIIIMLHISRLMLYLLFQWLVLSIFSWTNWKFLHIYIKFNVACCKFRISYHVLVNISLQAPSLNAHGHDVALFTDLFIENILSIETWSTSMVDKLPYFNNKQQGV